MLAFCTMSSVGENTRSSIKIVSVFSKPRLLLIKNVLLWTCDLCDRSLFIVGHALSVRKNATLIKRVACMTYYYILYTTGASEWLATLAFECLYSLGQTGTVKADFPDA